LAPSACGLISAIKDPATPTSWFLVAESLPAELEPP